MSAEPSTTAARTRPSLRRKIGFTLGSLLAGIALLAFLTSGTPGNVRSQLATIRAAGEPTDAASVAIWIKPVPPSRNGAIQLIELIDGLRSPDTSRIPRRSRSWDSATLSWAAAESARLQAWRNDLHNALQAPAFRYRIDFTNGIANVRDNHRALLHKATTTLNFWAAHSAALKLPDESAIALLDAVRVARTLDDEPILMSWYIRAACLSITTSATENTLTLTPLPDARLAELQAAFLDADQPELLSRTLITERVSGLEVLRSSPSRYVKLTLIPQGVPGVAGTSNAEWIKAALVQTGYRLSGAQGADTEYYLKILRKLIDISRLSGPARMNALLELENRFTVESTRWNHTRSRASAWALFAPVRDDQRTATLLRSAAVACAVERFRNAHQDQLPASLADLVPAFLPSIPLDPATNQSLRFRPLNRGYVVYGIGPDGEDNQGIPDRSKSGRVGTDITFTVER